MKVNLALTVWEASRLCGGGSQILTRKVTVFLPINQPPGCNRHRCYHGSGINADKEAGHAAENRHAACCQYAMRPTKGSAERSTSHRSAHCPRFKCFHM